MKPSMSMTGRHLIRHGPFYRNRIGVGQVDLPTFYFTDFEFGTAVRDKMFDRKVKIIKILL